MFEVLDRQTRIDFTVAQITDRLIQLIEPTWHGIIIPFYGLCLFTVLFSNSVLVIDYRYTWSAEKKIYELEGRSCINKKNNVMNIP